MPRISVLDPVGKRKILTDPGVAFNFGTVDVAAVFQDLLPDLVSFVELCEILVDELPGVFTIDRIGPALGKLDLAPAFRDFILEFGGSPTGAPVELQPFLHGSGLGGLRIVREDAGVGD